MVDDIGPALNLSGSFRYPTFPKRPGMACKLHILNGLLVRLLRVLIFVNRLESQQNNGVPRRIDVRRGVRRVRRRLGPPGPRKYSVFKHPPGGHLLRASRNLPFKRKDACRISIRGKRPPSTLFYQSEFLPPKRFL